MSPGTSDDGGGGEDNYVSIPRGGPIYVTDMVGPLTRVPDFELSVFSELQNLKEEIGWDSPETCGDDISVDELKIIKVEELVSRVFEEAFKDGELIESVSQASGEIWSQGGVDSSKTSGSEHTCGERLEGMNSFVSQESSKGNPADCKNTKSKGNVSEKRKKRGRANQKNHALEERYVAKVQQLARIKQRQDEDKAAARLHSFNGSSSCKECSTSYSEKTDRMTSLKSSSSSNKVKSLNAYEHLPIQFPEVILCFEVYHSRKTWTKMQEFMVLGRQFLTEVRDKIYCSTDEIMKKAGRHDPSGYFLIEDVFCNDLREATAIDYSKPIFEWLEQSRKDALEKWESIVSGGLQQKQKALLDNGTELKLPRFKSVKMQNTRFCDLRFQLGAGYLYCHQGDCKHVIVIRDMRLIHPEDVQNQADYPLVTFQLKLRLKKCSVCKMFRATKVTVDDKWAEQNPCYFCDLCYYMLHYVNGSLLYHDFSVFDYYPD